MAGLEWPGRHLGDVGVQAGREGAVIPRIPLPSGSV